MPFQYVDARAKAAAHWYQYLTYPLQWTGSQLLFLLPMIGLLALLYAGSARGNVAGGNQSAFDRRYVAAVAVGPFAVTTAVAVALGRLPVAMWGYPLWSFAPLAVIAWLGPVDAPRPLLRFGRGTIALLIAAPVIYAGVELFEPFVRDRPKATQFPGASMADMITRRWRDAFGTPLEYVAGSEFVANLLAVYSSERPHVVVHGDPALSPWVDMNDLHRRGVVLLWEDGLGDLDLWHATFGPFAAEGTLEIPRPTWHPVRPARIHYGFVAPQLP